MASASGDEFELLIAEGDFDAVLCWFDKYPAAVRRLLTRITYSSDVLLHKNAIVAFRVLSKERATRTPEFFREVIRRHVWGMNDEGGNIDWSAPEIIAAIITGCPELFSDFIPIMYHAAVAEPTFHDSLYRGLEMIAEVKPDEASRFLNMMGVKKT